jgi:HD-like signal output (HDOD) protein
MTAENRRPTVLVADSDRWTAEMLAQLVRSVRGDADIHTLSDSAAVADHCRRRLPDLVIADYELPGSGGLDLLRQVRKARPQPPVPFMLIKGRADAGSVRAALPLHPTAYMTKPFEAERLLQRLREILVVPGEAVTCAVAPRSTGELEDCLKRQRDNPEGAPMLAGVQEALQRLSSRDSDLTTLEAVFSRDPQLTAQLIAAANSAERSRGSRCNALAQALPRLGLVHSLNLALGASLQRSARLDDPLLAEQASHFWQQSQRAAHHAQWLAARLRADADCCYTAGLLHRLGELAVLRTLQHWRSGAGELSEALIASSLANYAHVFGMNLRMSWRLPLDLRELVGACYVLGSGVYSREALIMNLACQVASLADDQPVGALMDTKPARMLGLEGGLLERLPRDRASAVA